MARPRALTEASIAAAVPEPAGAAASARSAVNYWGSRRSPTNRAPIARPGMVVAKTMPISNSPPSTSPKPTSTPPEARYGKLRPDRDQARTTPRSDRDRLRALLRQVARESKRCPNSPRTTITALVSARFRLAA